MSENWYKQTMRKIHFDMHTPEDVENVGLSFDPQAFADAIKETGTEADLVTFIEALQRQWLLQPDSLSKFERGLANFSYILHTDTGLFRP